MKINIFPKIQYQDYSTFELSNHCVENTIEYSDPNPPLKKLLFAQKQQKGLIRTHSFLNLTKFVIFITLWSILKYKPTSAV